MYRTAAQPMLGDDCGHRDRSSVAFDRISV
jgi:hypothetical protein